MPNPMTAALAARLAAWRARPLPAGLPGRVRELRELHEWTQADLAIAAGLSSNGVRQIEAGRRKASCDFTVLSMQASCTWSACK